jgi:hypothetical protein
VIPANVAGARREHFGIHWPAWTALRHFLPAPLLRELIQVIVNQISTDTLRLGDLFEERYEPGVPGLEVWALRALPVTSPTGTYLQRRIQSFLWQTDGNTYPPENEDGLASDRRGGPIALEAAVNLGVIDFAVDPSVLRIIRPQVEQSLAVLLELIESGASMVRTAALDYFIEKLAQRLDTIEPPLSIVMTKHLGDLCADIDEWNKAAALYCRAQERLAVFHEPQWKDYTETLRDVLLQSNASATRVTQGAGPSFSQLHGALQDASLTTRPLLCMNAAFDAVVAKRQAAATISDEPEWRGTLLLPPLYHDTHDLDLATQYAAHKQFRDAQRTCWAVLRRQIALGLAFDTRVTRALFGRVLVASVSEDDRASAQSSDFELGVRLLLESGDYAGTEKLSWSTKVVATFVDDRAVANVVASVSRYNGSKVERQKVAIELFNSWVSILPDDRRAVANRMLRYLAVCADEGTATFLGNYDVSGRSLEVLETLAKRRPEFRRSNRDQIQTLIISQLGSTFWRSKGQALELALQYMEVLSDEQCEALIENILALLARMDPAKQQWPIVRPAMHLLVSVRAAGISRAKESLGKQVLSAVLRFGTEQSTESSSLLFYLRAFDPQLLADPSIIATLQPTIDSLRKDVANINSSAVVGQLQALLLSPTISGRAGVEDALNSLERILQSSETKHPSIGLAVAYDVVMMLVDRQTVFSTELAIDRSEIDKIWHRINAALLNLWSAAKVNPLVFASFSLPAATKPNLTIVHNWAFASVRFAESLDSKASMMEALQSAMEEDSLRDGVALAMATGAKTDEQIEVAPDKIRLENSEVFYSALGRRLALLPKLDIEPALRLCKALLAQCFRYGPRGIDAGVLVYAAHLGMAGQFEPDAGSNYLKRVEESREIRMSLLPLLVDLKLNP